MFAESLAIFFFFGGGGVKISLSSSYAVVLYTDKLSANILDRVGVS